MKLGKKVILVILCFFSLTIWGTSVVLAEKPLEISTTNYLGEWIQSTNGKWWYRHHDESYTRNDWEYINEKWYYFDADGWMYTGWLVKGESWYYLSPDGYMFTGWLNLNGKWYYLNENGNMHLGWLNLNERWYYLNPDGSMYTGWLYMGENWYYLNEDGLMATGWLNLGGIWYNFNTNGAMYIGWLYTGGNWFYLNDKGAMQTGWLFHGVNWYLLAEDGKMITYDVYAGNENYHTFAPNGVYLGKYIRSYWECSTYTKINGEKKIIYAGSSRYMGLFNQAASIWNAYKPNVILNGSVSRGATIVSDYEEVSTILGVTTGRDNYSGGSIKFNVYQMNSCVRSEQLNVALHELGHGLGLSHNQKTDILYAYVQSLTTLSFNDKINYDYSYKQ